MSTALIARVNNEPNIHSFIDEDRLIECLQADQQHYVQWMKIFNSKITLSGSFILTHIRFIKWEWLVRPLPEAIVEMYVNRIVQWNVQLYSSTPRTFEFIMKHKSRFDWHFISRNPPVWFNDLHYECFGSLINWKSLTPHTIHMNLSVLNLYAKKLDWVWISTNHIRSEIYARLYAGFIHWDHPNLDVTNLSTEFLYSIRELRELAAEMHKKDTSDTLGAKLARQYDCNTPIRVGATISKEFIVEHYHELNMQELIEKKMISEELLADIEKIVADTDDIEESE